MHTQTVPARSRGHALLPPDLVAVVVAAVIATACTVVLTRTPPTVDRLTIDNPHPWELAVEISPGGPAPRTALPVARAGVRHEVPDVLDQGAVWVFHLRIAGVDLAPIERTRARLEADDWVLRLPDGVADELREAGVPVSPR